jgi:hypothetical protein
VVRHALKSVAALGGTAALPRKMRKLNYAALTAAVALLCWGARLLVRHGCSNGAGRLLLPDAVAEPSDDRSPLNE